MRIDMCTPLEPTNAQLDTSTILLCCFLSDPDDYHKGMNKYGRHGGPVRAHSTIDAVMAIFHNWHVAFFPPLTAAETNGLSHGLTEFNT